MIPGSPHDLITKLQMNDGDALGVLKTARKGLKLAGCSKKDINAITKVVEEQVDEFGWQAGM